MRLTITPSVDKRPLTVAGHNPEADHGHTVKELLKVLEDPPSAWEEHKGAPRELQAILEAEIEGFQKASKNMSSGLISHADYVRHIIRLAAAAAHAYDKMTCKN